jgi:hypothetical protein
MLSPIGNGAFTSRGNVLCESEDPSAASPDAVIFDISGLFTPNRPGIASENRLRLCSFLLHNKRRTMRKTRATTPTATPTIAPVDSFLDSPIELVPLMLPTGALIIVTSVVLELRPSVNEGRVFNVELDTVDVDIVEFKDDVELDMDVVVLVVDATLEGADLDVVGSGSEFVITR